MSRRNPKREHPELALPAAHAAWLAVVKAYNLCDQVLAQRLAPLGLKVAEHEVLINLLLYPGATQQQLAAHCFVGKSVMSGLVSRLEQASWLERHADERDARAWRLQLTPSGERLARQALAMQTELVNAMTADLSSEQLAVLQLSSEKASSALRALLA